MPKCVDCGKEKDIKDLILGACDDCNKKVFEKIDKNMHYGKIFEGEL